MRKLFVLVSSLALVFGVAAAASAADTLAAQGMKIGKTQRVDTIVFDNTLSKNTVTILDPAQSAKTSFLGGSCTPTTCDAVNLGTTIDFDASTPAVVDPAPARYECQLEICTVALNNLSPGPTALIGVTWTIAKPSGGFDVLTAGPVPTATGASVTLCAFYTPDEVGGYTITCEVTTDCVDECPLDNIDASSFDSCAVTADFELACTTFITKSKLDFSVCYTNISCTTLGLTETVTNQLRALLFANGKSAGDFSSLLEAIPTLDPGATWCDFFAATVPPTTKSKKVQKILRNPMRAEVRVKVDGVIDPGSTDYVAFRVEEKGTGGTDTSGPVGADNYWMIDNDEGHDINTADGFGGANGAEIGYLDTVFGNEGFWGSNFPNKAGDAWGQYSEGPPNAGATFFLTQVDVSFADFGAATGASPAEIAIYHDDGTGFPDLTNAIYGPSPFTPLAADSVSGGDHGQTITFTPATIGACEPIHTVYYYGAGRQDGWGRDNPAGIKSGGGAVAFERSYGSTNDLGTVFSLPGNLIVGYKVNDPAGAAPSTGEGDSGSFGSWKTTVLKSNISNR